MSGYGSHQGKWQTLFSVKLRGETKSPNSGAPPPRTIGIVEIISSSTRSLSEALNGHTAINIQIVKAFTVIVFDDLSELTPLSRTILPSSSLGTSVNVTQYINRVLCGRQSILKLKIPYPLYFGPLPKHQYDRYGRCTPCHHPLGLELFVANSDHLFCLQCNHQDCTDKDNI